MKNNTAKKAFAMIIIFAICISQLIFAASAVSDGIRGSITITTLSKETKEPVSGAVFRVYHIASAYISDDSITFIYTDDFKDNGMDINNFSDAYLPIHLIAYAQIKSISYIEKTTDSMGRVVFDNLPVGAYLVVPVGIDEGYLKPIPFVVKVPTKDDTQNRWVYNIDATPKVESDKGQTDEKTYISVKKYWKSPGKTPDSITASLVMDGAIFDSVILSAANNWYHKWENLDKNHSWSVVETDVPDGYIVSYVTSQMTVVITNTDDEYEEETTTGADDTTASDETTNTDDTTFPGDTTTTQTTTKPGGTTKPTGTTESTTKPEELIDTGQLNWPVPIFSILGMLLFSAGWVMFNSGKKNEETP